MASATIVLCVVLAWCTCATGTTLHGSIGAHRRIKPLPKPSSRRGEEARVLVELYVMSRCPDAQRAEGRFDEVFGITHSIVDIRLHYIADLDRASVVCKHGPLECAGNRQQLCVAKYATDTDRFDSLWRFVRCQDASPPDVGKPVLAKACLALLPTDQVDVKRARACMSGREGEALLRRDVLRTHSLGVEKSCTIFIDGKKRCVHDGGQWYDCEGGSEVQDFVHTICDAYEAKTGNRPGFCGAPAAVASSTA